MTDPEGQNGPSRNAPGDPDLNEPPYADRVFRSVPGVISGVILLAVAAWLIIDALVYGSGRTPVIAVAAALLFVPGIIAYTLRPAVYSNEERLTVRNPLRTVVAPWGAVEGLRAGYSVELLAGGKKYQVWAVPVSLRQRKRAGAVTVRVAADGPYAGRKGAAARSGTGVGRSAVPGAPDPTRAWSDQVVDTLRETAERNAGRPEAEGELTTAWCWWIVAPALAGLVALVLLIATG